MSKDKSKIVERLREKILPENRIFVRKNLAISDRVEVLRREKGWTQKELAQNLGKTESEVSRLLSGLQNITLKSIAKLEAVLGNDIIITPLETGKHSSLNRRETTAEVNEPKKSYQKLKKGNR